jgi:type IV secretory pathway ATPase VirB11/archaellum biosynthesis ATPase
MDHVNAMFKRNPNYIILGEVRADGGEPFAYLICFIGLLGSARGR